MRKSALRVLACLGLLLALAAAPAEAKIYCWNCTCANPCSQLCFNGSTWETCAQYLCAGDCGPIPFAPPGSGGEPLAFLDGQGEADSQCPALPAAESADPGTAGVAPARSGDGAAR
jgi:hypothetical protein